MRIMNLKKRAIIILLIIGIVAIVSGCVRYPGEHEPEPGEPEYQLQITVEVAGEINTDDGIYYIGLDTDGDSATGPWENILLWEDSYYYIKLEGGSFDFAQNEEDSSEISLTSSSVGEKEFQVTIALSDLGDPSNPPDSIDINVITTDSEGNNYDYLESYFTINTDLGSSKNITDNSGDLGDGGEDFDIVKVTAVITTLY